MNLAVHLIALLAFGSCIMIISRLSAQLIFTQKLLATLLHQPTPAIIIHDPPHLITTLLSALHIPYIKGASIKLGDPAHHQTNRSQPPALTEILGWIAAAIITLRRAKLRPIRLSECLRTLQGLSILKARYDQDLLISSWTRWSIQPILTLWIHPSTTAAHAEAELAELLHTCVHVKIITANTPEAGSGAP